MVTDDRRASTTVAICEAARLDPPVMGGARPSAMQAPSASAAGYTRKFRYDSGEAAVVNAKDGFVQNFFSTRPKADPKEMFTDRSSQYFVTV